ncbi:hypothetical protein LLG95_00780, partial [bacterium]|nr:hypothetical protein [bacterium]
GGYDKAQFFEPEGMAVDGDTLYVADRRNHSIRKVDLEAEKVTTIAGNGKQGWERKKGGAGKEISLASPWDLLLRGDELYIAMAGLHQIWSFDRVTGRVGAFAGSGREGIRDGNNADAALAQPSGLSFSRNRLYFADSEVSAVRYVDLAGNRVQTLVGTGLFDFGDRDGRAERALLQHPLDLAVSGNMVYIADTYNHKIKFLDIELARIETIYGGAGELYEPGGISLARGKLYIADTNHHRILVTDIPSRWTRELALMGWPARTESPAKSTRESVVIGPLRTDAAATIRFDVHLPPNTELNMLAPMTVNIAPVGGARLIGTHNGAFQVTAAKPHLPFEAKIPITDQPSEGIYNIDLTFAYCTESDKALCIPASIRLQAKIATNPNGQPRATIHHALKPPSG